MTDELPKAFQKIIDRTLERVPPCRVDDALNYVESRLRPVLPEPTMQDVSGACWEAEDKYAIRQPTR